MNISGLPKINKISKKTKKNYLETINYTVKLLENK